MCDNDHNPLSSPWSPPLEVAIISTPLFTIATTAQELYSNMGLRLPEKIQRPRFAGTDLVGTQLFLNDWIPARGSPA